MDGLNSNRGTKRKRMESPEDPSIKVERKIHHSLKEVKKAAKKAKAFEVQKLIKKLKELRRSDNNKDVSEIEGELEHLKGIEPEILATTAFKSKLNKVKFLRDNRHVQFAIAKELRSEVDNTVFETTTVKVKSRLLSSKTLASEINLVVDDLKAILQPTDVVETPIQEDDPIPNRTSKAEKSADNTTRASRLQRKFEDIEGAQDRLSETGWESGTINDDDSDVSAGSEYDSDLEEDELQSIDPGTLDGIEKGSDGSAASSEDEKLPAKQRRTGVQTTFLPSLSVGFTRGESDASDLSESEIKAADINTRKNRRGQRARRAIWEKKYGKHANHKKKEMEKITKHKYGSGHQAAINSRSSYSRTSTQISTGSRSDLRSLIERRGRPNPSGARYISRSPAVVVGRVDQKPIHPSWDAKKKLKQRATIVQSQGTKIKFS